MLILFCIVGNKLEPAYAKASAGKTDNRFTS